MVEVALVGVEQEAERSFLMILTLAEFCTMRTQVLLVFVDEAVSKKANGYVLRTGTSWVSEVGRKERLFFNPLYQIVAEFPFLERTLWDIIIF